MGVQFPPLPPRKIKYAARVYVRHILSRGHFVNYLLFQPLFGYTVSMSIRKTIQIMLEKAVVKTGPTDAENGFIMPRTPVRATEEALFGDYTSPLPFQLAKVWKRSPEEIGETLKRELLKIAPKEFFERIDVVKGFLNVTVSKKIYQKELGAILKEQARYGSGRKSAASYSLDYLDANPTGPIHIGHARSGFLGDCLARVLKKAGYRVSREFYVNNAKSSGQIKSLGKTALGRGGEYAHAELNTLLKKPAVRAKLKKMTDEGEAGFFVARLIQEENKKFLKKAGIEYDIFFEEQSLYDNKLLDGILGALQQKGVVYEKGGALWFRASQFGDTEDRVFVRSTGEPTYVLPDLAYHWNRLNTRKFDSAIDIFGADHHGYGPRLTGALAALGIDPSRITIITTQTVRLMKGGEEFKMSKRKGVFVTLQELIDEVGLDATRFFFLAQSPDTHMDFDLTIAKEQSNKNPVYYVQYSHARIASILRKVKRQKHVPYGIEGSRLGSKVKSLDTYLLKEKEEVALMRMLAQFPEVVEDAARDYHVARLTAYATELARAFHFFYEKHRVISDDARVTAARLALIAGTQIVLKNTLDLMGISLPKKM